MKKHCYLIIILLAILNLNLQSQVSVNTSGDAANTSSMLDVSSTEKGILIPRMTKAQRDLIDSPENGLLIYQNDNTPGFYFYNGAAWVVVGDGATSISSLYDGASDGSSVFLGNGSGANDDETTNQNLGYGISALNANTSGYENTAIGIEALKLVDGGHHNTALGIHSLSAITTGSSNTALGTNAGISNTGSGNIFIGANAAYNELGSNKLYIQNSASATPLIYGDFDNVFLRIYGTLDINNAYQFPTTAGTNGQLLKTDGSGSLSWADDTNTGATNIDGLSDGKSDGNSVFLGAESGDDFLGGTKFNTALGVWSLREVTSGSHNSAFGTTALQQLTTGSKNTVLGMGALNSIIVDSNNTAIGTQAGQDVTGSGNIFIGNEAAKTQTAISNKLFIDNSDTVAPLIYGDFENDTLTINGSLKLMSENGIGSKLIFYEPIVDGNNYTEFRSRAMNSDILYQLPSNIGYNGDMLKTDGSGNLFWHNTSINDLSDGKSNGYSVYLGTDAGLNQTAWNGYNTGIGCGAMNNNTTGGYNTGIGRQALNQNQTGNYNIAIGYRAGYNTSYNSKSSCIFIGYKAGYSTSASNRLYIEPSESSTPLIYGEFDNDLVRINGDLEVTGTINAYSIGDFAHGGIVFWVDGTGQHGLVCSKTDQSSGIHWYNGSNVYTESRGDGIYSGEMNTILIIAEQGYDSDDYAAGLCANLEVTENSINYGDWYLPSLTELTEIYNNRTVINTTAAANSGTALTTTGSYWSSTEGSNGHAYIYKFHDGGTLVTLKSYTNYVRAVRRF